MRYLLLLLFLGIGFFGNAQEVERNGKTYVVKKGKIMHDSNDVTSTFSVDEQATIKRDFSKLANDLKKKEKAEKRQKNLKKTKKELKTNKKRQKRS